ncbi:MAG: MBL fold metallo-hydrolase [Acidiferrobacteraceae bacterium]|jgi:sulfur dioxygenase
MFVRQLFDKDTSTYTYIVADPDSGEAAIIDAVREQTERDTRLIEELGFRMKYILETHVHADHVTGASALREHFGAQVALHRIYNAPCADLMLEDGDRLSLGSASIEVLHTPGHTDGDISYRIDGAVFTGDALLIRGCGRTDFQAGDAHTLYESIREKIFTLPDETVVWPGHDYRGHTASTVGEEKRFNPRLGNNKSEDEFVEIMDALNLPDPKRIQESVPGNLRCGSSLN